jgi:hypothetical protein
MMTSTVITIRKFCSYTNDVLFYHIVINKTVLKRIRFFKNRLLMTQRSAAHQSIEMKNICRCCTVTLPYLKGQSHEKVCEIRPWDGGLGPN